MPQRYRSTTVFSQLADRLLLPCVLLLAALNGSAQNFTIVGNAGTQSLAGSGPNPFVAVDNTSRGTRQQYIIRGQELLDAGIPANAQIISVGFNITQAATTGGNVQNLSNWQVTLFSNNNPANTSPLGSWVSAPVVASSVPATINVGTTGWKHTDFSAPYVWPGGATTNLVIQACYNNANTNANNTNTHARIQRTTNLSTTAGVRSRWLIGSATSGICSNTDAFATTNEFLRPMVQIGWILEPTPGNTLASVNPVVCGTTALSVQNPGTGFTYQWQSSPDNTSYTDIGGATASTYMAAPSADTWYRCAVSLGGNPVNSTPILVTVTAPDPGATTGPSEVACIEAQLGIENAQVAGIFYSWEASTTGDVDANYSAVGGSSATFTATVDEPTWFRCRVECPSTELFTYSTALLVTPDVPNAGSNASLTICTTAPPEDMFQLLGAEAGAGGTWSGPSPVSNGLFNPATMVGGIYVYTVVGTAPCPNATATVTVVIDPCLGMDELAAVDGMVWLGQQTDGTHVIRYNATTVYGWLMLDVSGRTVATYSGPVQGELLHIPLYAERAGIYVVRVFTPERVLTLRILHGS
jgi:hypothetical protein